MARALNRQALFSKPNDKDNLKVLSKNADGTVHSTTNGFFWMSLLSTIVCLAIRLNFLDEPMSRDEGAYAYLGKMAIMGKAPYIDYYEMKPPLLYYLYGLGGKIFGFGDHGMRILALLLVALSCFLIYKLASREYTKSAAALAPLSYAFMSLNLHAMGFSMVAEHMVNVFILLGLVWIQMATNRKQIIWWLYAGLSFGAAVMVKQVSVVLMLVPLFIIFSNASSQQFSKKYSLMVFAAGVFGIISLSLLLAGFLGSFKSMFYWLWEYPSQYTSSVNFDDGMHYLKTYATRILGFSPIFFSIIGLCLLSYLIFNKKQKSNFLWVYLLAAILTIIPGLRFYGQYWLLIMPALAMLIANQSNLYPNLSRIFSLTIVFVIFLEMSLHSNYYFSKDLSQPIAKMYRNNPFNAIRKMSIYIGKKMSKTDKLLVLGSEPQVYLYSDKLAGIPHIYTTFIMRNSPQNTVFRNQIISYLIKERPEYVFFNLFPFSWMIQDGDDDTLYKQSFVFVNNNYKAVAAYDITANKYLYADEGQIIDTYKPNQLLIFKRK